MVKVKPVKLRKYRHRETKKKRPQGLEIFSMFSPLTSSQVSSIGQSSCSLETASKFSMTHWSSVFFRFLMIWGRRGSGSYWRGMVQGASLRLELMYVYSFGNQIMKDKNINNCFFTCQVGLMCELYKVTHVSNLFMFPCLCLAGGTYHPIDFIKHFLLHRFRLLLAIFEACASNPCGDCW